VKLIIPKKLIADPKRLARALTNAMNGVAKDVQVDFKTTTQNWQHAVDFPIESPSDYRRTISTDDAIYGYVNDGTRPHRIAPKGGGVLRFNTPFQAKTVPGQIMSGPGSAGGSEVFSRGVNHPGTKPRNFDKTIKEKWDKQFGTIMQRALDSEVE
jgi:hypothetical protein